MREPQRLSQRPVSGMEQRGLAGTGDRAGREAAWSPRPGPSGVRSGDGPVDREALQCCWSVSFPFSEIRPNAQRQVWHQEN